MVRFPAWIFRLAAFCTLLAVAASPASGQEQNPDEQACINTVNKSGAKVASTQGKDTAACVKGVAFGKTAGTVDQCFTADLKSKVASAKLKVFDAVAKKCADLPAFGFTSATIVGNAASAEEIKLAKDVFGNPADPAIIDSSADKVGAVCQASVAKGYESIASSAFKGFLACKKTGLKAGSITDGTGIEDCVGSDLKLKVPAAVTKLEGTIGKKCPGVDLAAAFPGCAVGTAATLASCAETAAKCRTCLIVNKMDGVNAPCDELDNGVLDASCAQCGNGNVDEGEECDDSGESAACNPNCTVAVCGDLYVNTTAGEECEDGNKEDPDPCTRSCRDAACGDGIVCSDPACTTGPGGGPEECDLGVDNGGALCSVSCELPPADPQCPDRSDLTLFAGTGRTCANNADCPVGTCDNGIGRCRTATVLDTGWTGIAHGSDINDEYGTRGRLVCPGPAPACGECVVTGLDPVQPSDNCRCANDNRAICDEPFQADADDCGGNVCQCFLGAPLPLSAGNTPACILNRFARDVSGTTNIDTGDGRLTVGLRSQVYLGETTVAPCPYCSGTCTAPATGRCTAGLIGNSCSTNMQCDILPGSGTCTPSKAGQACDADAECDILAGDGVCTADVPKDGNRDGVCVTGRNAGLACDVAEPNATFPAPGGGGHSFDCFPDVGKNVSGAGLIIDLNTTTGPQSLSAGVECGFPPGTVYDCPCGVCSLDSLQACSSNADCVGYGECEARGNGDPLPNQCAIDGVCNDVGGGQGECNVGPDDKYCDGATRGNGEGFISCVNNADCLPINIGVNGGNCTIVERRKCFLDPITTSGSPHPTAPIGGALICIPPTANPAINTVAGIPGPGRVVNQTTVQAICPGGSDYTPGGSCP